MLRFEADSSSLDQETDTTLPVVERFVSINGEGAHAGQFSTFLRFAGCNLGCSYCDTSWACDADLVESVAYTPRQLLRYVQEQGTPCVTITGGEPTLQPALPLLLEELAHHTHCFIEIETNGSTDLDELEQLRHVLAKDGFKHRIGFTMDWKSPSSGMDGFMRTANLTHLGADDCLKFVVGSVDDLDAAADVLECSDLLERCVVYFSPIFGAIEPAEIVAYLQGNDILRARVQLQLHKFIWPHIDRGV